MLAALAAIGCSLLEGSISKAASTRHEVVRDLVLIREARAVLLRPATTPELHPALRFLAPLLGESTEPKLAALRQLAETQLPAGAFVLRDVALDREFPHRNTAIQLLVKVPHPSALETLTELLDDFDPAIRRSAARALGDVGLMTVERDLPIAPIVQRLKSTLTYDPAPGVRIAALDAMVMLKTRESWAGAFEVAIHDPDILVRCGVLELSANLAEFLRSDSLMEPAHALAPKQVDASGVPITMGVVARAMNRQRTSSTLRVDSPCSDIGLEALRRLAQLRAPKYFQLLLQAAESHDAGLRALAVEGLANYVRPEVLPIVAAALEDPIRGVRRAAIEVLADLETEAADRHLAEALAGSDERSPLGEDDRQQIAFYLDGPSQALPLVELLAGGAVQVRRAAGRSLIEREQVFAERDAGLQELRRRGAQGALPAQLEREIEPWRREQRRAEEALVEALGSGDERLRARAGSILAAYGTETSFDGLLEALRSGSDRQREAAALALGLRGNAAARIALETTARSQSGTLAVASIRALRDLGLVDSLPLLNELAGASIGAEVAEAIDHAVAILEAERLADSDPGTNDDL